jgi:succinate-semialdehyde dehydrogenase/glutarate-semialdehyde dehydrogenase
LLQCGVVKTVTHTPPAGYDGPALRELAEDGICDDSGHTSADDISVTAPFTGAQIGRVPACRPEAVRERVERAAEAQAVWASRSVQERVSVLEAFATRVREREDDLLDLVQLESGKTRYDALEEVLDVVMTASHYGDRAAAYLAPEQHAGAIPLLTQAREYRDPFGVVGFITPWNYPLTLAVSDAIPALLAGNAVVIEPAEETPHTALFAARLLHKAGVPPAAFQVVTGRGETVGPPLIETADYVSFTGSTAVGRKVATRAGESLVPVSLELGGKGPMVVRADAQVGRAVSGAVRGGFASAGQLCIATERVYVHESTYRPFRDALLSRVRNLNLGTTFDFTPDVGSMVSERQLEKVERHVEEAVDAGATLLTGGRRRPDVGHLVYEPTVLTDVPPDVAIASEETFGPVVTLTSVTDDDEAIERANSTEYGLHASVWTGDRDAGQRLARRLECGTVSVNDAYISMWGSTGAPMGGKKASGIGRRHGDEGFEKYTQSQSVTVQRGYPLVAPPWLPNRVTASALSLYLRVARRVGWL